MSTPTCSTVDKFSYSSLLIERFHHQHKGTLSNLEDRLQPCINPCHRRKMKGKTHLLIYHIERRFIDQSNIKSLLPTPKNSVPRSVKHLSKRNDVSSLALRNNLIFPRNKFIIAFKEPRFSIFLQDPGYLGTGRKDKSQSAFEKDMLDDGQHLGCISREVEEGLHVGEAIVGIKVVDT
jgi:hypothetical protein